MKWGLTRTSDNLHRFRVPLEGSSYLAGFYCVVSSEELFNSCLCGMKTRLSIFVFSKGTLNFDRKLLCKGHSNRKCSYARGGSKHIRHCRDIRDMSSSFL